MGGGKPVQRISRAGQLTTRDCQILRLAGQGQVASLALLHRRFWPEGLQSTARYRLAQLVGSGYLQTAFTNVRRPGEQVYCLTEQGAAIFTFLERQRFTPGMPGTNDMRQQLDAQEARYYLERRLTGQGERLLDWKSEREIRSAAFKERDKLEKEKGRRLNMLELAELPALPDARATVERTRNGDYETYQIDIEIDGAYFNAMLKAKLVGLLQVRRATGRPLIWVTTTHRRAERIKQEIAKIGGTTEVTLLVLDEAGTQADDSSLELK